MLLWPLGGLTANVSEHVPDAETGDRTPEATGSYRHCGPAVDEIPTQES
jgi:hypothetical protein